VSTDPEVRVQKLCTEVLAAKTKSDVERIIPELRAALEDHIRLAKDSLGEQATRIALFEGAAFEGSPPA
jgi:hypothetical protein